jgi:chromosome segregation ATPase
MGDGLKQQWGVDDPAQAGSDQQSQQFQAAFQQQIGTVNGDLQYTAANAEETRQGPLAGRRDALLAAFQSALGQIDPANASKAKATIDKVLGDAKALGGEVAKFRQDTEKAVTDWQARQPKFDAAVQQVEELESWGDPKATALRTLVDGIRTQVNARRYPQGSTTVDQLLPKLQPLYENYQTQKAAKEQYDQALAALQPKLTESSQSKYAKLASVQEQMVAIQGQMETAAQNKDYVQAYKLAGDLSGKVNAYGTALADLEQKKTAYEQALAELQPKLAEVSQSKYAKLTAMQQEMVTVQGQMETAAQGEDYEQAMSLLTDLSGKVEAYSTALGELEQKKTEYEQSLAELQPKLAEVSQSKYPKLDAMQQDMVTVQGQMETAAKGEDYEQALNLLKDLSTKVEACASAQQEIEKKKADYEQALAALQPKLTDASRSQYASLEPMQQDMLTVQGQMEEAAKSSDFEQALNLVKDLTAKVDAFLTARQELEQKYQTSVQSVETSIAALKGHGQKAFFTTEIADLETRYKAAKAKGDANDLEGALKLLQPLVSACSQTRTTMDMVSKGLAKARAKEVADVSQSLIDSGVDREKAVEIGQVTKTGGHGDAGDAKVVAKQLSELPTDVIKTMNANGTKVVACRGSITDHRTDLKGVTPRGWPAGSTWDTVPGVYLSDTNEVVIATRGQGTAAGAHVPATGDGHGAYDLAAHESMHSFDLGGGGTAKHDNKAFLDARKKDLAKLGPYFTQAGDAGLEETFAESAARYYGGDPTLKKDWPNLYKYWESQPK